jgi:hypothetical protein
MCNACGFYCCASDCFSGCGCEWCPEPACRPDGFICQQVDDSPRIIGCETCDTEGRILRGAGPDPKDYGPCPVCDGTGGEIIRTEPVTLEDLSDCEFWDQDGCYCVCGSACSCRPEDTEPDRIEKLSA